MEPSISHRPIGGDVNRLLPLCPSLLLAVVPSSRLSSSLPRSLARGVHKEATMLKTRPIISALMVELTLLSIGCVVLLMAMYAVAAEQLLELETGHTSYSGAHALRWLVLKLLIVLLWIGSIIVASSVPWLVAHVFGSVMVVATAGWRRTRAHPNQSMLQHLGRELVTPCSCSPAPTFIAPVSSSSSSNTTTTSSTRYTPIQCCRKAMPPWLWRACIVSGFGCALFVTFIDISLYITVHYRAYDTQTVLLVRNPVLLTQSLGLKLLDWIGLFYVLLICIAVQLAMLFGIRRAVQSRSRLRIILGGLVFVVVSLLVTVALVTQPLAGSDLSPSTALHFQHQNGEADDESREHRSFGIDGVGSLGCPSVSHLPWVVSPDECLEPPRYPYMGDTIPTVKHRKDIVIVVSDSLRGRDTLNKEMMPRLFEFAANNSERTTIMQRHYSYVSQSFSQVIGVVCVH